MMTDQELRAIKDRADLEWGFNENAALAAGTARRDCEKLYEEVYKLRTELAALGEYADNAANLVRKAKAVVESAGPWLHPERAQTYVVDKPVLDDLRNAWPWE